MIAYISIKLPICFLAGLSDYNIMPKYKIPSVKACKVINKHKPCRQAYGGGALYDIIFYCLSLLHFLHND